MKLKALKAQEPEPPKRTWLDKIMEKQTKTAITASKIYPPRVLSESHLLDEPEDDVFPFDQFKARIYSFAETIEMHRELMHPQMLNKANAFVRLKLDLNMNTEKKTKFVENSSRIITPPFMFEYGRPRTVIAFAEDKDMQQAALDAGAEAAGGVDLIKQVMKGQFSLDGIDIAVAHADIGDEIGQMRGLLKKRFPSAANGALGFDIPLLVKHFKYGLEYELKRDFEKPEYGICDVIIGKLNMPVDQLEANCEALVKSVCTHRTINEKLGHFVQRAVILVVPSTEFFSIPFSNYVPLPVKQDSAEVAKK